MSYPSKTFIYNSCSIRAIKQSDVKEVLALQKECNLSYWSEEECQKQVASDNSINLVAIYKNKLIGFITSGLIISNKKNLLMLKNNQKDNYDKFAEAEIFNIVVYKNFQRKGIGAFLLKSFLKLCREKMVNSIWLEVREFNFKAIKFYEAYGFKKVYSRKNYYLDPTENALVMKLDLFDVL